MEPISESSPPGLSATADNWWTVVAANRVFVVFLALLGAFAGVGLTFVVPKTYESSATVLFPADSGSGLKGLALGGGGSDSTAGVSGLGIQSPRPTAEVAQAIFTSRGAAGWVYDKLDLATKLQLPKQRDRAITEVQKHIIRVGKSRTSTETLTAFAPDPELARLIVLKLLDYYKFYSGKSILTKAKGHRLFMEKQLGVNELELSKAEQSMVRFESKKGAELLEAEPENRSHFFEDLYRSKADAETKYRSAQSRFAELQKKASAISAATNRLDLYPSGDDQVLAGSQKELVEARAQLENLRKLKTDLHPDVINARSRIAAIQEQLHRRTQAVTFTYQSRLSRELAEAEVDLRGAEAAYRTTSDNVDLVRSKIRLSPSDLAVQKHYTTEYSLKQELNKIFNIELARAKVQESLDSTDLEVLDPPEAPSQPTGPRKYVYGTIGLVMGMMLGALLSLVKPRRTFGPA